MITKNSKPTKQAGLKINDNNYFAFKPNNNFKQELIFKNDKPKPILNLKQVLANKSLANKSIIKPSKLLL